MSTNEPAEGDGPAAADRVPTSSVPLPHRAWPAALAAGILAALLTGGAGEVTSRWHDPDLNPHLGPQQGGGPTAESVRRTTLQNAMLTYGVQGAVLGLLLGLAGGIAGRSAGRAIAGGLAGVALGGAAGAGAALGAFTVFLDSVDPNSDNLVPPLLAHGAVWGLLGAAGGLAFGVGFGRGIARATLGGLLGAVVGAGVYEVPGALLFATAKTSRPLADTAAARLFGHAATDLLAALGAAMGIAGAPLRKAARPHDPLEGP